MNISAKGRYALAACIVLAEHRENNELASVLSIATRLDLSKIYLEQVFSLLKKGKVVRSVKGASGGYGLIRPTEEISVYDILLHVESGLFEPAKETVGEKNEKIEDALFNLLYVPIDEAVKEKLISVKLSDLYEASLKPEEEYMFYI